MLNLRQSNGTHTYYSGINHIDGNNNHCIEYNEIESLINFSEEEVLEIYSEG